MKKIMFNDRYGLTEAVLSGGKTQTRRIITNCTGIRLSPFCKSGVEDNHGYELKPKYYVGEIVAIAQSYKEAGVNFLPEEDEEFGCHSFPAEQTHGWNNKMFVRAELMPHQIRITNVSVERLQDISDPDIKAEGVDYVNGYSESYFFGFGVKTDKGWIKHGNTLREAYAALIDRISGKDTWESNPYVFVYDFELI